MDIFEKSEGKIKPFTTVTQIRLYLSKNYKYIDTFEERLLSNAAHNRQYLLHAINLLKGDLKSIFNYREKLSDPINEESFLHWFPHVKNTTEVLKWLDVDRDFTYNSHGMSLLQNRYLRKSEPIQYCMLRIAKLFAPKDDNGEIIDFKVWRIMYDALSCGFMHASSILSDADHADKNILPGEACRLVVSNPNYNREFINQINEICNLTSLGVGVGMSATTVPLHGSNINGQIRNGFRSFAKKLDSCNLLSIYERKPKIAIYIEMHNDTIYESFELRNPLKNHLENVFVGVMISDYFIECYENDEDWYLFPSDAKLDGKTLCNFVGNEYKTMFKRFVKAKLYSKVIHSSKLMDDLVTCISETGSPYVIWSDNVNKFSNHKHLGKIKTLNLCAEIANFATVEQSSSCTLISINYAMYSDYASILESIYKYVEEMSSFEQYCGLKECELQFKYTEMSKFAYAMGFIGTLALNNFMGKTRQYRELGVSPLGVYDMALIGNVNPVKMVASVSEAMYKGCIHSSCKFSNSNNLQCKYYDGSPFSQGIPQWMLRDEKPSTDWSETLKLMKLGMANSQLTAQAPTATTSMLVGVSESVTFPMSILMARESENGRNDLICYGLFCKFLNEPNKLIKLNNDIDRQILMYKNSAPFVDQSQSTMFSIVLSRQNILNLIMDTFYAKLKTSIYYILPKQTNKTLTIVKNSRITKCTLENLKRSSNLAIDASSNKRRRPSCEACSA